MIESLGKTAAKILNDYLNTPLGFRSFAVCHHSPSRFACLCRSAKKTPANAPIKRAVNILTPAPAFWSKLVSNPSETMPPPSSSDSLPWFMKLRPPSTRQVINAFLTRSAKALSERIETEYATHPASNTTPHLPAQRLYGWLKNEVPPIISSSAEPIHALRTVVLFTDDLSLGAGSAC